MIQCTHLRILKVPKPKMQGSNVVENFWWNISLNFLLQDMCGCSISRQCPLYIGLLKNLGKFYPGFYIVRKLFSDFLEMLLKKNTYYNGKKSLFLQKFLTVPSSICRAVPLATGAPCICTSNC